MRQWPHVSSPMDGASYPFRHQSQGYTQASLVATIQVQDPRPLRPPPHQARSPVLAAGSADRGRFVGLQLRLLSRARARLGRSGAASLPAAQGPAGAAGPRSPLWASRAKSGTAAVQAGGGSALGRLTGGGRATGPAREGGVSQIPSHPLARPLSGPTPSVSPSPTLPTCCIVGPRRAGTGYFSLLCLLFSFSPYLAHTLTRSVTHTHTYTFTYTYTHIHTTQAACS